MTAAPGTSRAPSPTIVCSMCRARIAPAQMRYRCSVSACNIGRLKLRFCSVGCFERHIPTARHRRAICVEESPS
ncbi:MAG TPA: hypothetical protein VKB80_33080 [Kofleriaceae bacterium]|nr:hypothetical protein [Kofleriaceae bacterium]